MSTQRTRTSFLFPQAYWIVFLLAAILVSEGSARDFHVNHQSGNDGNSGLSPASNGKTGPFKTIIAGLAACRAGDTLHLAKTKVPYHEPILIEADKSGTAGKPIIIDGHGATLSGGTSIIAKEWSKVGDGLYRNDGLVIIGINAWKKLGIPKENAYNPVIVNDFFFVWNGQMKRMGKTSKGGGGPFPKPSDLQPGEWTFDDEETAFYLKIDPSKRLEDEQIEYPDILHGLQTSEGKCEHIVVRNLTVTHFIDDGFNINGDAQMRFENIRAIECGDDGFSAHSGQVEVNGFVSIGNGQGICDVLGSNTKYRHALLKNNVVFEVLLTGSGSHELRDCVIFPRPDVHRVIRVTSEQAEPGKTGALLMENVLIDGEHAETGAASSKNELAIEVLGKYDWTGRNLTLLSVGIVNQKLHPADDGHLSLFSSIMTGKSKPSIRLDPQTEWNADKNLYDLEKITVRGKVYQQADFDGYRKVTQQDATSVWGAIERNSDKRDVTSSARRGVDRSKLPPDQ